MRFNRPTDPHVHNDPRARQKGLSSLMIMILLFNALTPALHFLPSPTAARFPTSPCRT
jgi:hypothetical protein